jgi:hypothetical protein
VLAAFAASAQVIINHINQVLRDRAAHNQARERA